MSQYTPPSSPNLPGAPPTTAATATGSPNWTVPPVSPSPVETVPQSVRGTKLATGILAILLGFFGIHKFMLGNTGAGITMLLLTCTVIGFPVMYVIGIGEGIIYLTRTDEEFYRTYIVEKRQWF
ncbi:MAG: NINE protein [Phycisphaerae bacterium]|nr:NINE protein [Phycisphaerae bacterium]